ncbi:MAG: hypothetical protein PVH19_00145 [Planctomycetia bacterium]|jgi:hypothetical protein
MPRIQYSNRRIPAAHVYRADDFKHLPRTHNNVPIVPDGLKPVTLINADGAQPAFVVEG